MIVDWYHLSVQHSIANTLLYWSSICTSNIFENFENIICSCCIIHGQILVYCFKKILYSVQYVKSQIWSSTVSLSRASGSSRLHNTVQYKQNKHVYCVAAAQTKVKGHHSIVEELVVSIILYSTVLYLVWGFENNSNRCPSTIQIYEKNCIFSSK